MESGGKVVFLLRGDTDVVKQVTLHGNILHRVMIAQAKTLMAQWTFVGIGDEIPHVYIIIIQTCKGYPGDVSMGERVANDPGPSFPTAPDRFTGVRGAVIAHVGMMITIEALL